MLHGARGGRYGQVTCPAGTTGVEMWPSGDTTRSGVHGAWLSLCQLWQVPCMHMSVLLAFIMKAHGGPGPPYTKAEGYYLQSWLTQRGLHQVYHRVALPGPFEN